MAVQGGLLAAYAAGMPVALTAVGAEGLADGDGETCLLGESYREAMGEKRRVEL